MTLQLVSQFLHEELPGKTVCAQLRSTRPLNTNISSLISNTIISHIDGSYRHQGVAQEARVTVRLIT